MNVQDDHGKSPLHFAVQNCQNECVSELLAVKNINVNIVDCAYRTPLHYATFSGSVEMVKALLAHHDVNVNIKNKKGLTPLSLAFKEWRFSRPEIAVLLFQHGATSEVFSVDDSSRSMDTSLFHSSV